MNRLVAVVLAAVVLVVFTGVFALKSLTRPGRNTSVSTSATLKTSSAEEESVRDVFRRGTDLEACRAAVQQLNLYLTRNQEKKAPSLTEEEQGLLANQFHFDAEELAEVNSPSFTLLDAHHLELCFLLRDATRSLRMDDLDPLVRAETGFAWVVRQVRLRERPGDVLPPHFVLRRGWGTAHERALVFLALLEQLDIGGCMIAFPADPQNQSGWSYWIPGALVGQEIHLFDTRLGIPLPGPEGKGIATLAQVRAQPDLLRALVVDEKLPYDVPPEQAKQAEVRVACSLTALSPRMRDFQEILGSLEKINVAIAPAALLERFQAATRGSTFVGSKVEVWNEPGKPRTPFRVLRSFLPQEEGGIDKSHRLDEAKAQVVPWQYFPRQIAEIVDLPGAAELGQQLKATFATPFVYFSTEARMPSELLMMWLPGLSEASADKPGTRKPVEVLTRSSMPRDLVLRGRFDEAAPLLVAIQGELQRQKKLLADPKLNEEVFGWCKSAIEVYAGLIQANERARKGGATLSGLAEARQRVDKLWQQSGKVMALIKGAAAEPMSAEVVYLIALCKHEQAERAQAKLERATRGGGTPSTAEVNAARDLWKAAAGWWETYLDDYGTAPTAPSARLLRARTLRALGEHDSAIALVENLSGDLTNLEKTARLFLAKQWKTR